MQMTTLCHGTTQIVHDEFKVSALKNRHPMVDPDIVLKIMLEQAKIKTTEEIELLDSFGRILAKDFTACHNQPPFARSPLDGYAMRSEDIKNASGQRPVTLHVIATVYAGSMCCNKVKPGTAVSIMTGAPVPDGTDCVIRFEDTSSSPGKVTVYHPLKPGENVIYAGEDVKKGEILLHSGTEITPAVIGALAAQGCKNVHVFRRPRVAVFSTGNELAELTDDLQPAKIYNSSVYSISAMVKAAGAEPLILGTVPDCIDAIKNTIQSVLGKVDMIISTGGVSVGKKDFVKEAFASSGVNVLFWKPGSPMVYGVKDSRHIIGLTGNPGAAMIIYTVIVQPLLRFMNGRKSLFNSKVRARMVEDFRINSKQRRFVRAVLFWEGSEYLAKIAGSQNSGFIKSMVECNALIDIPAGHGSIRNGEIVEVMML